MDIQNLLTKFDLDKKEAEIYLLLLKRKSLTATEISNLTKIPKTTVYRAIDNLKQNKLAEEIIMIDNY